MDTAARQRAAVDEYTRLRKSGGVNMGGSIEQVQKMLRKERGVKGPIWVSKTQIPRPSEPDAQQRLWKVVKDMSQPEHVIYEPDYAPGIPAQWTGRRKGVQRDTPEPQITDTEKYQALDRDAGQQTTILYFQGGGFVMGGAASARPTVAKLCQIHGARTFTIDYRLSPQHTLPAQHLDALLAYFYLISPPPGAYHAPVAPSSIVFSGESAGASLALALIQILLSLRRTESTIRVWGQDVPIALPAGFAGTSIPGDFVQALPSFHTATHDWLGDTSPWMSPKFPPERIWPSTPPRGNVFCEVSAIDHPLFSVTAARDWRGAPPLWFAYGAGETTADGARLLAQTAASQGVSVTVEEYEYMTHAFAIVIPRLPQSTRVVRGLADAAKRMAEGKGNSENKATFVCLGDLGTRPLDVYRLVDLTTERARELMKEKRDSKINRVWTGDPKTARL